MIFCHYFLSLLCLFIHQGHQPLLLPCASFHNSCKNCCWGYNLEEAESLVFGGVLETYLAHSFIAKYPATAGANHYTTATVQILSSHRGMCFISAIEWNMLNTQFDKCVEFLNMVTTKHSDSQQWHFFPKMYRSKQTKTKFLSLKGKNRLKWVKNCNKWRINIAVPTRYQ